MTFGHFQTLSTALLITFGGAMEAAAQPEGRLKTLISHSHFSLLKSRGLEKEASEVIAATLQSNPQSLYLLQLRVRSLLQEQNIKAAHSLYQDFCKRWPEDISAALSHIHFLQETGLRDSLAQAEAIKTAKRILKLKPGHGAATLELINLYEMSGQPDEALKVLLDLRTRTALPFSQAKRFIRTLAPRDEMHEMLSELAEAAAAQPQTLPDEAYALSEHFRKGGRLPLAQKILRDHCEAVPSSLKMRTRLCILQFMAGEPDKAVAGLRNVIEIDPGHLRAHRLLAKHFLETDQPQLALPHRHKVLTQAGGQPEDFIEVANSYSAAGRNELGLALLRDARFYHPENVTAAIALAEALLTHGQTTEANRLYREAETLAKDSPFPEDEDLLTAEFQLRFAQTLIEAGSTADAESRLRMAVKSFRPEQTAESADALTLLAQLWMDEEKNLSAAKSLLRRAQQLVPDHAASSQLLNSLKKK